jgi:hypothetical protein
MWKQENRKDKARLGLDHRTRNGFYSGSEVGNQQLRSEKGGHNPAVDKRTGIQGFSAVVALIRGLCLNSLMWNKELLIDCQSLDHSWATGQS